MEFVILARPLTRVHVGGRPALAPSRGNFNRRMPGARRPRDWTFDHSQKENTVIQPLSYGGMTVFREHALEI